jgi:serine/threonine-protein kinase
MGETVRVGVRLIGTDDGFQLWARRFDTPLKDLLIASDGVARAIAGALTAELPTVPAAAASDAAAIELYLRAKQEFWRSWSHSAAAAAELFERALLLAPADAKILAGTAQALARMLFFGEGDRPAIIARCGELCERAVLMAPELGDSWAALASHRLNLGDPVAAARALRSGLAHAPNSAALQDLVGRLLAETASLDEAIARLEIALGLDPTLVSARVELSRLLALQGDWDRALSTVAPLESSSGLDWHLARIALWRRTPAAPSPHSTPGTYGHLYCQLQAAVGLSPEQREFMRTRAGGASGRIRALLFQRNAEVFAFMGETEEALRAIRSAVDAHLIDLAWLERCPLLQPLRGHAHFQGLHDILAERARRILESLRGEA